MVAENQATNEIVFYPIDRRNSESIWLQRYRSDNKSQSGEDGLIKKIFDIIGTDNKVCIDFSAGDRMKLSNSFNLIKEDNWSGVLLEPDAGRFERLQTLYFKAKNLLDTHLKNAPIDVPKSPDFLSIEIDGNDLYVWLDLSDYLPRVVCIEFNHFIPLDVYFRQARNLHVNVGFSLLATTKEAKKMGYELVATTNCNAFFVDRQLFRAFMISDIFVESMYFLNKNETKLAPAYDGTL